MAFYHDNKLTMVGLDSDIEESSYAPLPSVKRKQFFDEPLLTMSEPISNIGAFHDGLNDTYPEYSTMFDPSYEDALPTDYSLEFEVNGDFSFPANDDSTHNMSVATVDADCSQVNDTAKDVGTNIKSEDDIQHQVSLTPNGGSEYDESDYDERRPSKAPKLNKDGVPRKPRQPRPKLLKWDDNDWKNVALGLVWACGENRIQIPFDQASQIVSESCTAGALQQALLKLRSKQVAEGFQIPTLRMAWTRKNKNTSLSSSANTKSQLPTDKDVAPKKKPTRFAGSQCKIIVLKRAYKEADRRHLAFPFKHSQSQNRASDTRTKLAKRSYDPTAAPKTSNSAFESSFNCLPVVSPLGYASLTLPSYDNVGTSYHHGLQTGMVNIPLSPSFSRLATEPDEKLDTIEEDEEEYAAVDEELTMTEESGFDVGVQSLDDAQVQDAAGTSVQDASATPTRYESAMARLYAPITPVQTAPTTPIRPRKHRRTESVSGLPAPLTPTTPTYVGPYNAIHSGRSSFMGTQQSTFHGGGLGVVPFQGFSSPYLTNQGSTNRGPAPRGLPDQGDYDSDGNRLMSYSDPVIKDAFPDFSGVHF
jgi:hypothetical protein